jgi:hypothetical protein
MLNYVVYTFYCVYDTSVCSLTRFVEKVPSGALFEVKQKI